MKIRIQQTSLAICSILLFTYCKKDNTPPAINKENLSGTYKLTAYTATSPLTGSELINLYDMMLPCQRDNTITLNTDFTATYTDAGVKCVPPEDASGTWNVTGKTFTLDEEEATIEKFDGNTLILSASGTQDGIPFSYTSTFTKQD
ncbi:MAG TPA: lipocalin family protein [Agriterribacter sp.]|nr:lipocalin family protein [Agriterribacter sp.]